ncbi:DUF6290 family protein [Nonomuraea polychroma]|jgi:hypothetical protein|uniref:DUF6290 family protein n=1 Tax=Nonomuraea polychroma TaxID=46176 RepID=UPI003D9182FA
MAMTIRFTEEETEQLRQQAAEEGVAMAEVVRRAVAERIQRQSVLNRLRDAWGAPPAEDIERAAASLGIDPDRAAQLLGVTQHRAAS